MSHFKQLNLSTKILSSLERKGYTTPTPIQAQSIPHLLLGKDLLGIAQTGTGKTAAFSLPILENLFASKNQVRNNHIRALILTPTRELATQIGNNIKLYGQDLGLSCAVIFGGVNINGQIANLKKGCDIVIATPGRLLDLMNQGHVRFSQLEIFVLDEADRMLDMGFINDVKKIISKLPKERQTLFFSATMPRDIAALANSILTNPVTVEITPQSTTVEKIDQKIHFVDKGNKPLLLKSILTKKEVKSVLVFSKTKHGANRIVEFLSKELIPVLAIHGNKSQAARERALEDFRSGRIKVLIATDIAARGIDVAGITHVINYDIPHDPESYVHRIGRTARAGLDGVAISFCDHLEIDLLKAVEKVIKYKIPVDESHPFHGVRSAAPAIDARERKPRSGFKSGYGNRAKGSDVKSSSGKKTLSYFAQGRRSKDGFDDVVNGGKPKTHQHSSFKPKSGDKESSKSYFGENRKSSNNSDGNKSKGPYKQSSNKTGPRKPFSPNNNRRKFDNKAPK